MGRAFASLRIADSFVRSADGRFSFGKSPEAVDAEGEEEEVV